MSDVFVLLLLMLLLLCTVKYN